MFLLFRRITRSSRIHVAPPGTSSIRNSALLYVGITDGNVDDAFVPFNCKLDHSFRGAFALLVIRYCVVE